MGVILQISFLAICYPVLILTYLGQTAWLTAFPDQVGSTFYASIPFGDGFYWVSAFTNAFRKNICTMQKCAFNVPRRF